MVGRRLIQRLILVYRYIESMSSSRQRSVSKWDASLSTNARNAQPNAARPPPTHWIRVSPAALSPSETVRAHLSDLLLQEARGRPITREEDVVRALWRLREELLGSTCNLAVERDYAGVL